MIHTTKELRTTMDRILFKICGKLVNLEDDAKVIHHLRYDDEFTLEFFQKAYIEGRLAVFGIETVDNGETLEIIRLESTEQHDTKVPTDGAASSVIVDIDENENTANNDCVAFDMKSNVENTKCVWDSQSTKLLLDIYRKNIENVGKSPKLKSKKNLWKIISEEMSKEKGLKFTPIQIENRYKTLDRGFKYTVQNNKKTGRSRASCEFEKLIKKKKSVFPEFLLDATSDGNSPSSVASSSNESDNKEERGANIKKCKKARTVLEEIRKFRELRENEILLKEEKETQKNEFRKNILELEKAKVEAYKERNKILLNMYQADDKNKK